MKPVGEGTNPNFAIHMVQKLSILQPWSILRPIILCVAARREGSEF